MNFENLFTWKRKFLSVLMATLCLSILLTGGNNVVLAKTHQLMISPLRMVFTDRQRSINAHVSNPSNEQMTYTISLVTMRQGTDGKYYEPEMETEEELMVKKMIRFSPRRATIAPGTRQIVRMMVRKPKDLPPGEYRTRLLLSPQETSGPSVVQSNNNVVEQSSFQLNILVKSSFPIIIQHGGLKADVAPLSIEVKDYPQAPAGIAADVAFSRSGNCSIFGDVVLHFTPNDHSQDSREIGRSLGLAIYLPDTRKTLTVMLKGISREELSTGTVRVVYRPNIGIVEKRNLKYSSEGVMKDFVMH